MRWRDALLASCGVLFGVPSLAWPFGWDTAVHDYVGREWALRGAVPYRDTFDHKPPIIHLVHAVCVRVFGEGMWGIRLVELACVVVLGLACASVARGRGDGSTPDGFCGLGVLSSSVLYYGFFDYWNTAQCELLGTTLAALALVAAVRAKRIDRAAAVAGLVVGILIALKPPFGLLAAVPLGVVTSRAACGRRGSDAAWAMGRAALGFVAGTVVVPGLLVAYFASKGATTDLVDFVFRLNVAYLENEPRLTTAAEVLEHLGSMWRTFSPVAGLLFAASAAATIDAIVRRSRVRMRRWAAAWALLALSILTIGVQLKFYFYHWTTPLSAVVLMLLLVASDVSRAVGSVRQVWVPASMAAVLVAAYSRTGVQAASWRTSTMAVLHLWRGDWDRPRFASTFQTWDGTRKYADVEAVGIWVRDHSSPSDFVVVRGIAAEVYIVSGRRAPGRFFWTAFLTRPSREFHREAMLAEDRATIEQKKPRFVVTWAAAHWGVESAEWFEAMGYVQVEHIGDYLVLERGPAT
ncbi:MAG TPA: glycosyltransferase family 39 protein [Polyangiaceae bacterium]